MIADLNPLTVFVSVLLFPPASSLGLGHLVPQVDSGTAINAYAAWGALNGLGMYFATDKLMEAWGASGAKIQKTFLKGFGGFLTISSLTM